jgi:hypothetical protein
MAEPYFVGLRLTATQYARSCDRLYPELLVTDPEAANVQDAWVSYLGWLARVNQAAITVSVGIT